MSGWVVNHVISIAELAHLVGSSRDANTQFCQNESPQLRVLPMYQVIYTDQNPNVNTFSCRVSNDPSLTQAKSDPRTYAAHTYEFRVIFLATVFHI